MSVQALEKLRHNKSGRLYRLFLDANGRFSYRRYLRRQGREIYIFVTKKTGTRETETAKTRDADMVPVDQTSQDVQNVIRAYSDWKRAWFRLRTTMAGLGVVGVGFAALRTDKVQSALLDRLANVKINKVQSLRLERACRGNRVALQGAEQVTQWLQGTMDNLLTRGEPLPGTESANELRFVPIATCRRKYQQGAALGSGATGRVFAVEDNDSLVLKETHSCHAFYSEISAYAILGDQPWLPELHEAFACFPKSGGPPTFTLAMERLDGTLWQFLEDAKREGISGKQMEKKLEPLLIMLQTAISVMHGKCVVHYDLQAQNIMYRKEEKEEGKEGEKNDKLTWKIIDFGSAGRVHKPMTPAHAPTLDVSAITITHVLGIAPLLFMAYTFWGSLQNPSNWHRFTHDSSADLYKWTSGTFKDKFLAFENQLYAKIPATQAEGTHCKKFSTPSV